MVTWSCLRSPNTSVVCCLPGSSYQLEVLHRSNRNASPEVKTPALELLMPPWSLVLQNQRPLLPIHIYWDFCEPGAARKPGWINWFEISRNVIQGSWERDAGKGVLQTGREFRAAGNKSIGFKGRGGNGVHGAAHATRATGAKQVEFIWHMGNAIASRGHLWWYFFAVESTTGTTSGCHSSTVRQLAVINSEFGTQEVGPGTRKKNVNLCSKTLACLDANQIDICWHVSEMMDDHPINCVCSWVAHWTNIRYNFSFVHFHIQINISNHC